MLRRPIFLACCASLLLSACGHSLDSLPDFDAAAWRRDLRGCQGLRQAQLPALERGRETLYGARISAVMALLGRPDQEELQEQTQHVYYYYVAPGPQCQAGRTPSLARRLSIRFGSLGTVTEVQYSSGPTDQ